MSMKRFRETVGSAVPVSRSSRAALKIVEVSRLQLIHNGFFCQVGRQFAFLPGNWYNRVKRARWGVFCRWTRVSRLAVDITFGWKK